MHGFNDVDTGNRNGIVNGNPGQGHDQTSGQKCAFPASEEGFRG